MTKLDIREAYLRTMLRYPKTMALLGDYELASLRQHYNRVLNEEIPDDLKRLLDKLK